MDPNATHGQPQRDNHSPDSGTWVSFEDGLSGTGHGHSNPGGVSPDDVHISPLAPPPRRGAVPTATVHPSPNLNSLPSTMSPQQAAVLAEVDRVQKILDADMTLDLGPDIVLDSHPTVRIDDRDNGKILSVLRASNETCPWLVPPVYKPEMVPQKVAEVLQVPLEDYVMNLDVLVKDWRFRTYVILYKRLIGMWLLATLIVLLALLFSGLRGLGLFAAGLIWLIIAGSGMCVCLYGKKRISDGLRLAVAHANRFMMKQRLIVGVEDRGKLSLQKVVLPIIHYDVLPCLTTIAQLLEQTKLARSQNGGTVNVHNLSYPDLEAEDTTPMDKAELLMLRCVQPYIKELVKKRLLFSVTKVEDIITAELRDRATTMSDYPQLHPRHCKTSWCLCQYVDRVVIRRKPKKWFRKIFSEEI